MIIELYVIKKSETIHTPQTFYLNGCGELDFTKRTKEPIIGDLCESV